MAGAHPSFSLSLHHPLAHLLRLRYGNIVCTTLLQVDAIAPLLTVCGSSEMKLTIDRSATGCIILGICALIFLPSAKAQPAQCVGGWDWVRSYLYIVSRGLRA